MGVAKYFLINCSGWPNKLYVDDWFCETIIKLNKKKIWPFTNLKIDKFLREVIISNILVLSKNKEIMVYVIRVIKHGNWYAIIEIYNNVTFVVKLLVIEKAFKKILSCGSKNNGGSINIDLFQKRTAALAKIFFFKNYICQV